MLLETAIVAAVAFAASAALSRVVIATGLWDAPDDGRKAHRRPTPTSGGLAIAAGAGLAIAVACAPFLRDWADGLEADAIFRLGLTLAAAFFVLGLGLIDDVRPLGPLPKFGLLTLLSLAFALFVARAESLPLSGAFGWPLWTPLAVVGSALWIFTMINATNFIDGANGLAMGTIGIGLVGLAAISAAFGAPHAALVSVAGAAAMAGFLIWNFPNGKLFAGDAGSLFAGALAACASLLAIREGGVSPYIPAILFFPILADVLLTLAYRVQRKRNVWNGHREHFYQIGIRSGMSHRRVSLVYWAMAAHCGLLAFVAAFAARAHFGFAAPAGAGEGDLVFYRLIAFIAGAAPLISLVVLALAALKASHAIRRYAKSRGFDQV